MTICVPRKPFEVAYEVCKWIAMFSWIGWFTVSAYIFSNKIYGVYDAAFASIIIGCIAFIVWIHYLSYLNKERHWIEWCKK